MRSGFVGIAGRPNAGKSTLINALMNDKIAIVSEKPQTTRSEIRGIYSCDEGQIIFTDTPGINKPLHRLESRMNKQALDVIHGVDLLYLVIDGSVPYGKGDEIVLSMIEKAECPVFLILNKIDKLAKEEVLNNLMSWQAKYEFKEYFPISAKFGRSFEDLINTTLSYLPEGEYLYPPNITSDDPENFRIAELIREKVLVCTNQEVPHATAIKIENKEFKKGACYIQAVIVVEKKGQKAIIIGKQGSMIKRIGEQARKDIERLLGKKVYLELFVKIEDDWRSKDAKITEYGYGGANTDEFI